MANDVPLFLQGLMADYLGDTANDLSKRRMPHLKVGLGRSLQATGLLTALGSFLKGYGDFDDAGNRKMRSKLSDQVAKTLLRTSKRKDFFPADGPYSGLTHRQAEAKFFRLLADENDERRLHSDDKAGQDTFHRKKMDSNKAHHYVATRPLVSYRERNVEHKECTYGKYKDGSRWRCIQNLNHKRGGGEDEDGNDIVQPSAGDRRNGPHPRPTKRRRGGEEDDDDGGGGGGGGYDDYGDGPEAPEDPEDPPAETEAERKKRVRRENARKKIGDYNKAGANVRIPKGKVFHTTGKKYSK